MTTPAASAASAAPVAPAAHAAPAAPLRAFHRSNLLTYASLAAGIGAIAVATRGNRAAAAILIATSVIADTFDGRFARRFRRTAIERDIGVQLDSLSDAIAFGLSPVVCLAALRLAPWTPAAAGLGVDSPAVLAIFWLCAIAYAAGAITRLAFYNVTHDQQRDAFCGLPVPVAALILATALGFAPGLTASATLLILTTVAMVLPLPIPRPRGRGRAAVICWPVALIVWHLL
jgi:CDP-diacylglycerol--serine O-phosphatidyltransferase